MVLGLDFQTLIMTMMVSIDVSTRLAIVVQFTIAIDVVDSASSPMIVTHGADASV